MKVLLVHNRYKQPGGEDVVFEQERQLLADAGHAVTTYSRSNAELEERPVRHRVLLPKRILWATDTQREFEGVVSQAKPDIVHVHNTFFMVSPCIYSVCARRGIPVVQTLHNFRLLCPGATLFRNGHICEDCVHGSLVNSVVHGCYRGSRLASAAVASMLAVHRWRRTWVKEVNRFIALNEFCRTKFVEGGIPAAKISVKPNFIYEDPGFHDPSRGEYALFSGRLSPEKRVITLIKAWEQLKSSIPLLVIGGGAELEFLKGYTKHGGLTNIRFLGQLPRSEVLSAFKKARLLLFTSEWYESFPVTLLEAFASGVPVICSRIGAMREIVEDQKTGLHFSPGDAPDLARKVEWAWQHPAEMSMLARHARREFENLYTPEANYKQLMNIYEQAINDPTPRFVANSA